MDLGSGTGVMSIVVGILGCQHVVCTDSTTSVVQLPQDNVTHNAQCIPSNTIIEVREYWWGNGSMSDTTFDVILVSDCILPKLYPIAPLVEAIDELCHANSIAIISYEYHYFPDYHPWAKFCGLCKTRGLKVRIVPLSEQDPV